MPDGIFIVADVALVGMNVAAVLRDILAGALDLGLLLVDPALIVPAIAPLGVVMTQIPLIGADVRALLGHVLTVRADVGPVALDLALIGRHLALIGRGRPPASRSRP